MSDVIFRNNKHDTKWLTDVTVTTEAQALPQIAGRGTGAYPYVKDVLS